MLIALLVFIGLLAAGLVYEQLARRRDSKVLLPPGQLISIGVRRLHFLAKGKGAPSIIIEQGAGGPSLTWLGIQDSVSLFSRACLYDRAGYQWSDPAKGPRSLQDRVDDLHALFTNANIAGPHVLVAHSYGGFLIRLFAKLHPEQVAGLVFIDTPHELSYCQREVLSFYSKVCWLMRTMSLLAWIGIPRLLTGATKPDAVKSGMARHEYFSTAADDIASLQRSVAWLLTPASLGTLGDIPIAVVSHGQPFPGPFAVLEKNWKEGQTRLASLSTDSKSYKAERANHMIHLDAPEIVVEAIQDVVVRARRKSGLQNGLVETHSTFVQ